jgi:hypothetical protein
LAAWALVFIEKRIWQRYWESSGLDPRKSEMGGIKFTPESSIPSKFQENKGLLTDFWTALPTEARRKIIGNPLEEYYFHAKTNEDSKARPQYVLRNILMPRPYMIRYED